MPPENPPENPANPDLRALNLKIAGAYDLVPYDPVAIPAVDPERVFGLAALYGGAPEAADFDVLDLGCGTGSQLDRIAARNNGRLVGTDLSRSACELARARCAKYGDRCRIVNADFLDLDAAALGQFDLIYNIGVLYVTPPAVQERILALIAACLKPKGVAVISYYTGMIAMLTAGAHQMLSAAVDPTASPDVQVRQARTRLQEIGGILTRQPGDHKVTLAALQQLYARSDSILFHEMLNQNFTAIFTSSLDTTLGARGVHFLNWMMAERLGNIASSRGRATLADAQGLAGGGYYYAAFGKCAASQGANPGVDHVRWQTEIKRIGTDAKSGLGVFRDPGLGVTATAGNHMTEAMLEVLVEGPAMWARLLEAAEAKRAGRGIAPGAAGALEQDFLVLWQHGLVTPLWTPPS